MSMHSDHHPHWYQFDTTTWQTAAIALLALAGLATWFNMSGSSLHVVGQSLPIP